jgi:hypothetical protein
LSKRESQIILKTEERDLLLALGCEEKFNSTVPIIKRGCCTSAQNSGTAAANSASPGHAEKPAV